MKNNKLIATGLYHLVINASYTLSLVLTLIINLLVGLIVSLSIGGDARAGSTDYISLIFGLILGLTFFNYGFKFSIVNGTSRKSYYLAMLSALAITSLAWAIITIIVVAIGDNVGTVISLTASLYKNVNFGSFLWMFFTIYMLAMLGLFIRLIVYRSSKKVKFILFFMTILLPTIIVLINMLSRGQLAIFLGDFFVAVLGLKTQNPYIGTCFSIVTLAIFSGGSYLLVRRAPLK